VRAILLLCLLIGSIPPRGHSRTDGSRRVAPGQTVVGVIDAEHLTQMYIFTQGNAANEWARLQNSGVLALSLAVLDMAGRRLSVLPPLVSGGEASLSWPTSEGTSYYLLVFPADASAGGAGSFRLTLSGVPAIAPPATQPEAIPMGGTLQINLVWQAGARLSLEVREPQGQSLHWRNPQTANGGSFTGSSESARLRGVFPHTQTQTATWNAVVSGSYEILVHYVDGCETSIPFTLRARLGTSEFPMLSSTLPSADSTSRWVRAEPMDARRSACATGSSARRRFSLSPPPIWSRMRSRCPPVALRGISAVTSPTTATSSKARWGQCFRRQ